MNSLDLLLHPVRLRVVHALAGGRTQSTAELCVRLPDVPKTTVYRHVGVLLDAGMLEVAAERRVHGAVERHYRLCRERAVIDGETTAAMSAADHRHAFAAATATLLAGFNAYLDTDPDPVADSVGYRQGVVWLDNTELRGLIDTLRAFFGSIRDNGPGADRRPHLVSTIFFPTGER